MDGRDFRSIGRSSQEELRRWALFLRTTRVVRDLIEQRFGERLGLSTMPLNLQRWGLNTLSRSAPKKPLARAKERSPAAIEAWLETGYPALARQAKAQKAAIFWVDETGISNQDQIGRSWAPKGKMVDFLVSLASRMSRARRATR